MSSSSLGADYYRSRLSTQGKSFYDCLLSQLQGGNYSGRVSLRVFDSTNASSDCFSAYTALRDDHPEYFFLGLQARFASIGSHGILFYPLLYSDDIIRRVQLQLRRCICELVRGTFVPDPVDAEIIVYGRIAQKINYIDHDDVRDHNIVGPVLFGSGVCEGYTSLLNLCLRRIGIPCIKARGFTSEGTPHCWTIAWVKGVPVHCDVTWDRVNIEGIVGFNYLNLSDRQIAAHHRMNSDFPCPSCKSEAFTYHRWNKLCVNSRAELVKQIKNAHPFSSPLRLHIDYLPKGGDLAKEAQAAYRRSMSLGYVNIHTYPEFGNIIITRKH